MVIEAMNINTDPDFGGATDTDMVLSCSLDPDVTMAQVAGKVS